MEDKIVARNIGITVGVIITLAFVLITISSMVGHTPP
jgi:tetrahydromethanopterin S-methyltransferase subunit G